MNYLNSSPIQEYLVTCSTEKNQRNLTQRYLANAPFPRLTKNDQSPIVEEIIKLDQQRKHLIREIADIGTKEEQLMWKN
jgi:DNA-directed RNA polymerase subunit F